MRRINYRLDDLRALLALHATSSFVRGAALLNITQSAFSRRIAQLESAVGGSLVERSTRRVALSALGMAVVRDAAPVVGHLDHALEEAGRVARGESGEVVVSCLTTVAYALLPRVMADFRRAFPNVRLHLLDDTGQRVTASVLQRQAEFGVTVLGAGHPDLHAEHLADDPYVIAFAEGHALQARSSVAWSELAPYRPVALRSTSANRLQIDGALLSAGIVPPWFDEVEHLSSMLGMLRGTQSIGVLPRLALRAGEEDLVMRPLIEPAIVRRIGLVRRTDSALGPAAAALWTLLAQQLGTSGSRKMDGDDAGPRVRKNLRKANARRTTG